MGISGSKQENFEVDAHPKAPISNTDEEGRRSENSIDFNLVTDSNGPHALAAVDEHNDDRNSESSATNKDASVNEPTGQMKSPETAPAARAETSISFEETLDHKLREAGLHRQFVTDRGKKAGNTAYRRVVKFLEHSGRHLKNRSAKKSIVLIAFKGLTTCAAVADIPNLLISLTPGAITEYPSYLESTMQKPSTVTFITPNSRQSLAGV